VSAATAALGYTLRVSIPPKRWWTLALPCVAAVLLGLLSLTSDAPPEDVFPHTADVGLFALLIPIGCLVIGDAVLGAEIRAGTFHFTWLTPVPVRTIVLARWFGGWLIALVTLVPAVVLSAFAGQNAASAAPLALATAVGSAAYIALFVLVGCMTKRAAVWSLAIVFLVERLLGAALSGIAQLSPMWLGRSVYAGLCDDASFLIREGVPSGWSAVVRLVVLTVAMLALATWRLRHLRITGASD
jgi:ABC-type transport system involved in multi-copper enzyme maturation permease subunit